MPSWDPQTYARYAGERARPFVDLTARIGATAPATVVDLGCGSGELTATLAQRWPSAQVHGLDSSASMLEKAVEADRLTFSQGDVTAWAPDAPVDVIVSNAVLQWVPDHLTLLSAWAGHLAPGGTLALQVPANFAMPSHVLMREVAALPQYADRLDAVLRGTDSVAEPDHYATLLAGAGLSVDAWETTYLHVLPGQDAVLEWVRGTGLRPVLDALADDPQLSAAYVDTYAARLREAYPRQTFGTLLPFRRLFVVATRPTGVGAADPTHPVIMQSASTQPLVTGIDHVQVAGPAGSEDLLRGFYVGVLGMTERVKPPVLAARGGAWFRCGTAEIHCGVEDPFVPARKAHPGISVSDVDRAATVCADAGLPVTWDESIPGLRRFHTTDPVGNRIELQQG